MVTIDNDGRVIRRYNLPPFGMKQVVFFDESVWWKVEDEKVTRYFYVLNNKEIEKRSYPEFEIVTSYRPNVRNISHIFVRQSNIFF